MKNMKIKESGEMNVKVLGLTAIAAVLVLGSIGFSRSLVSSDFELKAPLPKADMSDKDFSLVNTEVFIGVDTSFSAYQSAIGPAPIERSYKSHTHST